MPVIDLQKPKEQYAKYRAAFPDPVRGGGLNEISVALWTLFLEWQRTEKVRGDVLEIGVWQGHGAALLAQHRAPDERVIVVDKFMRESTFNETVTAVSPLAASELISYKDCSMRLNRRQALRSHRDSVRFMHIDGEHSFEALVSDLDMCAELAVESGIVAVDDFFAYWSPSLTEAVFYWLDRNRHKLVLVLAAFNKAYLCSARVLPKLLPLIYELPFLLREMDLHATLCASGWATERPYFGLSYYLGHTHVRIGKALEEPTFEKMLLG